MQVGAVVLAGGGGVRLGGVDKSSLEVDGRTLLEIVLAALADVPDVVVVGAEVATSRPVTWRREEPAGGGPAAGLLAGLSGFVRRPDLVVVLAVDLPAVTSATVARLLAAAVDGEGPPDGSVLLDGRRRQHLCAAYRTSALLAVAPDDPTGLAVHRLVGGLDLVEVPAAGTEGRDVDTWDDLRDAREAGATRDTPGDLASGPGGSASSES